MCVCVYIHTTRNESCHTFEYLTWLVRAPWACSRNVSAYYKVCICVLACVCIYIYMHTHTHTYIYIYICQESSARAASMSVLQFLAKEPYISRNTELVCRHTGLFCGHTGLFCGHTGLFCGKIRHLARVFSASSLRNCSCQRLTSVPSLLLGVLSLRLSLHSCHVSRSRVTHAYA